MKYTSIPQFFIWHQGKIEWQKKKQNKMGEKVGRREDNTKNTIHKYNAGKKIIQISTETFASSNQSSNNRVNCRKMVFKF